MQSSGNSRKRCRTSRPVRLTGDRRPTSGKQAPGTDKTWSLPKRDSRARRKTTERVGRGENAPAERGPGSMSMLVTDTTSDHAGSKPRRYAHLACLKAAAVRSGRRSAGCEQHPGRLTGAKAAASFAGPAASAFSSKRPATDSEDAAAARKQAEVGAMSAAGAAAGRRLSKDSPSAPLGADVLPKAAVERPATAPAQNEKCASPSRDSAASKSADECFAARGAADKATFFNLLKLFILLTCLSTAEPSCAKESEPLSFIRVLIN